MIFLFTHSNVFIWYLILREKKFSMVGIDESRVPGHSHFLFLQAFFCSYEYYLQIFFGTFWF